MPLILLIAARKMPRSGIIKIATIKNRENAPLPGKTARTTSGRFEDATALIGRGESAHALLLSAPAMQIAPRYFRAENSVAEVTQTEQK